MTGRDTGAVGERDKYGWHEGLAMHAGHREDCAACTVRPPEAGGAVGERPACPLCGAPVEVTAMTYGFPKVKFSGGAVGERRWNALRQDVDDFFDGSRVQTISRTIFDHFMERSRQEASGGAVGERPTLRRLYEAARNTFAEAKCDPDLYEALKEAHAALSGGAVGEREEPLDVAAEVAYEMKVFLHGAKMAPPVAPGWLVQIEKWMARLSVNEGGVARTEAEPHE